MSPSERLAALHQLNLDEEARNARQASDLLALVVLGLFIGAVFIWAIIGVTPHE